MNLHFTAVSFAYHSNWFNVEGAAIRNILSQYSIIIIIKKYLFLHRCECLNNNSWTKIIFIFDRIFAVRFINHMTSTKKKHSKYENKSDDVTHFCPNIISFIFFSSWKPMVNSMLKCLAKNKWNANEKKKYWKFKQNNLSSDYDLRWLRSRLAVCFNRMLIFFSLISQSCGTHLL